MASEVMQIEISKISDVKQVKIVQSLLEAKYRELVALLYQDGKIYRIIHKTTKVVAYIGSTIQDLPSRWSGHKSFFNTRPNSKYSRYISDAGGASIFEIVLIEAFPCADKAALEDREMFFIRTENPPCNTVVTNNEIHSFDNGKFDHDSEEEHICDKCGFVAACRAKLEAHLNKKNPCNVGKYHCKNCRYRTNDTGNMSKHRKTCKGPALPSKNALLQENNALRSVNTAWIESQPDIARPLDSEHVASSSSRASSDTDIDKFLKLEKLKFENLQIVSKNLKIESQNLEMQLKLNGMQQ